MPPSDYMDEVRQVLKWLKVYESFRDYFFKQPDEALQLLVNSGFELSDRAKRRLDRLKESNFEDEFNRFFRDVDPDSLDQPMPETVYHNLPLMDAGDEPEEEISRQQLLQWLKESESLKKQFFLDAGNALDALGNEGYFTLSEADLKYFQNELTPDNFDKEFERSMKSVRAEKSPDAPVPRLRSARIVNTGFAPESEPDQSQSPMVPLQPATPYYFWFEVGEKIAGSIESKDVELPTEKLPPEAKLHVVLFTFEGEIEIFPGKDIGEIKIGRDGAVSVEKRAAEPAVGDELLSRRLFFPVRTPAAAGTHHLRCNVYYQQTLVQSRLITAVVKAGAEAGEEPALRADVDYTLSKKLDGHQLSKMRENRLSVMLNDNGSGTHGFRFFGQGEYKNDAAFDEGELQNLIEMARKSMRKAAWGDEEPFGNGKVYQYDGPLDEEKLKTDLVRFALRGYRIYDALINRLAGDADKAWDLADLMLKPGQLQLANKQSARLIVPLALFYDYPLDDGLPLTQYDLCPTFLDALKAGEALAETACFKGECTSYDQERLVCPSGFWGFRHSLGLPISTSSAPDAPVEIASHGVPKLAVSVSTDPNFIERAKHESNLQAMGFGWEHADSRDESLQMLKQTESQLVYFYCHGGLADDLPYLSVGPKGGPRITRASLRNKRIRWRKVRPLVVINGCHTTALEPEMALDLVSGFVEVSYAAGVIGTEITIFEPIAVAFAEECFRRFLKEDQTIGESVRGARLKMLEAGNPLGLVYIPYVLPGLKISKNGQ